MIGKILPNNFAIQRNYSGKYSKSKAISFSATGADAYSIRRMEERAIAIIQEKSYQDDETIKKELTDIIKTLQQSEKEASLRKITVAIIKQDTALNNTISKFSNFEERLSLKNKTDGRNIITKVYLDTDKDFIPPQQRGFWTKAKKNVFKGQKLLSFINGCPVRNDDSANKSYKAQSTSGKSSSGNDDLFLWFYSLYMSDPYSCGHELGHDGGHDCGHDCELDGGSSFACFGG